MKKHTDNKTKKNVLSAICWNRIKITGSYQGGKKKYPEVAEQQKKFHKFPKHNVPGV